MGDEDTEEEVEVIGERREKGECVGVVSLGAGGGIRRFLPIL